MYWIGWQGAIFGPLMLCFFIGVFEVAAVAMRANEDARLVVNYYWGVFCFYILYL